MQKEIEQLNLRREQFKDNYWDQNDQRNLNNSLENMNVRPWNPEFHVLHKSTDTVGLECQITSKSVQFQSLKKQTLTLNVGVQKRWDMHQNHQECQTIEFMAAIKSRMSSVNNDDLHIVEVPPEDESSPAVVRHQKLKRGSSFILKYNPKPAEDPELKFIFDGLDDNLINDSDEPSRSFLPSRNSIKGGLVRKKDNLDVKQSRFKRNKSGVLTEEKSKPQKKKLDIELDQSLDGSDSKSGFKQRPEAMTPYQMKSELANLRRNLLLLEYMDKNAVKEQERRKVRKQIEESQAQMEQLERGLLEASPRADEKDAKNPTIGKASNYSKLR